MGDSGSYRHPGGRTCAGAMLLLVGVMSASGGLLAGIVWAALR